MKTAIITGASSGLGREFARQLTDIFPEIECCWLIARREDRLEEIAREMVGVETVCLPLDLCDSMSFTTLQEKLAAEKPEVAILINKKGIHFKKLWRGILVLTIAVPQFISLLYVSKLFDTNGVVNAMLLKLGFIDQAIRFWENTTSARILVIVINIWVGIPYLMLVSTGILMNIPQDLYESSKIDGASVWQQYVKITLPYMLFVTGPYLLTQFIGNINNFNVIYLLTNGRPASPDLVTSGGSATTTDLLITWLFNITTGATSNYKLAAVIAIMIFVVVAVLSLIVYNVIPSTRNEEDYS